jgi:hypothetical protein
MIPEYKRYHGTVFAEMIDEFPGAATFEEWPEKGRLSSYVINNSVGLHVKHSSKRLRPWLFTFTSANLETIGQLRDRCETVFIVLVCWLDGMVCISDYEFQELLDIDNHRTWLRAERKRRELYVVSGPIKELGSRKANGVGPVLEALGRAMPSTRTAEQPHTSSASLMHYLRRLLGGTGG